MGAPVVHFEVHGTDGKALETFYSQLFDWKIDSNNPMHYGMVETGGEGGINGGVTGGANDSAWVTFYAQVGDLQATLDQAEKLGGKTVMPPTDIGSEGKMALFTDPAGNKIGIFKGM